MSAEKRFYCPACGTRITRKEFEWVRMSLAHRGTGTCLTNPDCDGWPI